MVRLILLLVMPAILFGAAAPQPGNALAIFNAFIARYARENIEWRADQKLRADNSAPVEPGYQVGKSALGEFSFRPRLFTELTLEQKRAVVRDSRLPAFITSLRLAVEENRPAELADVTVQELGVTETAKLAVKAILDSLPPGSRRPQDVINVVELTAEQILNDPPVTIYLPR